MDEINQNSFINDSINESQKEIMGSEIEDQSKRITEQKEIESVFMVIQFINEEQNRKRKHSGK